MIGWLFYTEWLEKASQRRWHLSGDLNDEGDLIIQRPGGKTFQRQGIASSKILKQKRYVLGVFKEKKSSHCCLSRERYAKLEERKLSR